MECILLLKTIRNIKFNDHYVIGTNPYLVITEIMNAKSILLEQHDNIIDKHIIYLQQHSLMPLFDFFNTNARIESGAIIRTNVTIHDSAIILMGAIINTNASIGARTMIDMNAVIGSGATIGNNCHIGAGCVIAGIMEPKCSTPVIVGDNVFIGANAVILEGVHIHDNVVIGAGCVITKDIPANTVIYEKKTYTTKCISDTIVEKTKLNEELR